MGARIKIQNKRTIPYIRTVRGVAELAERLRAEGIPEDATVDWRNWNIAEILWSSYVNDLRI